MRQIGPGFNKIWSDIQTDRDYYFIHILASEPGFAQELKFPMKDWFTKLETKLKHSHGSSEFPYQNERQICT